MKTVTVSPKFQIVIPLALRQSMGLSPGMQLSVSRLGDQIQLHRVPSLDELKAQLKGCGSDLVDEGERVND